MSSNSLHLCLAGILIHDDNFVSEWEMAPYIEAIDLQNSSPFMVSKNSAFCY